MVNLYIGNIPLTLDSEDLKELVKPYAKILSAKVVRDHATGASRGFGFITACEEEALKLCRKLNGQYFGEQRLIVRRARERKALPQKSFISREWREKAEYKL